MRLTLMEAAVKLKVCHRQAKRIHRRYETEGDAGVIHRLAGKASNNRLAEEVKTRALAACRDRYVGFGPTFAQEWLHELDKVELSRESLRQLLIREGLWERKPQASSAISHTAWVVANEKRPFRGAFHAAFKQLGDQ